VLEIALGYCEFWKEKRRLSTQYIPSMENLDINKLKVKEPKVKNKEKIL